MKEQQPVAYEKPRLKKIGHLADVTLKTGGAEDGGAAMMDKTGQG